MSTTKDTTRQGGQDVRDDDSSVQHIVDPCIVLVTAAVFLVAAPAVVSSNVPLRNKCIQLFEDALKHDSKMVGSHLMPKPTRCMHVSKQTPVSISTF